MTDVATSFPATIKMYIAVLTDTAIIFEYNTDVLTENEIQKIKNQINIAMTIYPIVRIHVPTRLHCVRRRRIRYVMMKTMRNNESQI